MRGKLLAQRRHVLPVDRGAVLVEEARLGERVAAGAKRAERDRSAPACAARSRARGVTARWTSIAAADEDDVGRSHRVERHVGAKRQAVARGTARRRGSRSTTCRLVLRHRRFAMRSGSTALVSAIIE
jgi:hypothetical protein